MKLLPATFCFLLFTSLPCVAQNEQSAWQTFFRADTKHSLTLKSEYVYQGAHYGSVGIGYLNPRILNGGPCNSFILGTEGFSLNSEFLISDKRFQAIPKISYEISMMLVATKMNLGMVTDLKSNCTIFTPEIGLTFFGYCYCFYGYNFIDKNIFNLGQHRVTVGMNFIR